MGKVLPREDSLHPGGLSVYLGGLTLPGRTLSLYLGGLSLPGKTPYLCLGGLSLLWPWVASSPRPLHAGAVSWRAHSLCFLPASRTGRGPLMRRGQGWARTIHPPTQRL